MEESKLRLIDIITPDGKAAASTKYVLRFVVHYKDNYDTYFKILINDTDYGRLYLPHFVFKAVVAALNGSSLAFGLQEEKVNSVVRKTDTPYKKAMEKQTPEQRKQCLEGSWDFIKETEEATEKDRGVPDTPPTETLVDKPTKQGILTDIDEEEDAEPYDCPIHGLQDGPGSKNCPRC